MVLYRPVGTAELRLIEESGWREYPPRLPEQPIFYPVLEEGYAAEIASRWNAKTGDGKGRPRLGVNRSPDIFPAPSWTHGSDIPPTPSSCP